MRGEAEDHVVDDVALMVSELVGNAVSHGGEKCVLDISRPADGVLRVAVTDCNHDLPRVGAYDTESPGGRGLLLIAALSQRWGHERHPGIGNTVWFEVPL